MEVGLERIEPLYKMSGMKEVVRESFGEEVEQMIEYHLDKGLEGNSLIMLLSLSFYNLLWSSFPGEKGEEKEEKEELERKREIFVNRISNQLSFSEVFSDKLHAYELANDFLVFFSKLGEKSHSYSISQPFSSILLDFFSQVFKLEGEEESKSRVLLATSKSVLAHVLPQNFVFAILSHFSRQGKHSPIVKQFLSLLREQLPPSKLSNEHVYILGALKLVCFFQTDFHSPFTLN